MKKLIVVSAVFLLLACQEHNPVQPAPDLTPELALALARGGPGNVVKMVPMKGNGTMWLVASGDDSFCAAFDEWAPGQTTFLESQGTSTQWGRVTSTMTSCYGEGPPFVRPVLFFKQTLRTANGDLVHAEGRPEDPDMPYQFIVHPDGSYEVLNVRAVGGTGRFENATGRWDCFGDNIFPLYSFESVAWTCEGEISSVGSSK
jgi:hypothetical protein